MVAKILIGTKMFRVDYVCFAQQTKIDLYLHSIDFMENEELLKYIEDNYESFKQLVSMELFKGRLDSIEVNKHEYQSTIPIRGKNTSDCYKIAYLLKGLLEYNKTL